MCRIARCGKILRRAKKPVELCALSHVPPYDSRLLLQRDTLPLKEDQSLLRESTLCCRGTLVPNETAECAVVASAASTDTTTRRVTDELPTQQGLISGTLMYVYSHGSTDECRVAGTTNVTDEVYADHSERKDTSSSKRQYGLQLGCLGQESQRLPILQEKTPCTKATTPTAP